MIERKTAGDTAVAEIREAVEDMRRHVLNAAESLLDAFRPKLQRSDLPRLLADIEADGAVLFEETDDGYIIADIKWKGATAGTPEIRFLRATDDHLYVMQVALKDPHLFPGLQELSAIERGLRKIENVFRNHQKP